VAAGIPTARSSTSRTASSAFGWSKAVRRAQMSPPLGYLVAFYTKLLITRRMRSSSKRATSEKSGY
jgi:hypothetical protein